MLSAVFLTGKTQNFQNLLEENYCLFFEMMLYYKNKQRNFPKLWNRGANPLRYGHRDDELLFFNAIDLS